MKKSLALLASMVLAVGALSPGYAQQQQQKEEIGSIRVEKGEPMSSTGGDFSRAYSGQRLRVGDRVMIVEGSSLVFRYDNRCEERYDEPGVYTLDDDCAAAIVWGTWRPVAIIVGTGIIAAAIIASGGTKPPYLPVSR